MDEEYYNYIHNSNPESLWARDDGWNAYMKGFMPDDNPYLHCPDDEKSKDAWDEGWMAASLHDPQD